MLIRILALVIAAACTAPLAAQGTAKWADPAKVLRTTIIIAETGFDPQASQDLYSNVINSAIFDALYQYDYLARPHQIIPRVVEYEAERGPVCPAELRQHRDREAFGSSPIT